MRVEPKRAAWQARLNFRDEQSQAPPADRLLARRPPADRKSREQCADTSYALRRSRAPAGTPRYEITPRRQVSGLPRAWKLPADKSESRRADSHRPVPWPDLSGKGHCRTAPGPPQPSHIPETKLEISSSSSPLCELHMEKCAPNRPCGCQPNFIHLSILCEVTEPIGNRHRAP